MKQRERFFHVKPPADLIVRAEFSLITFGNAYAVSYHSFALRIRDYNLITVCADAFAAEWRLL